MTIHTCACTYLDQGNTYYVAHWFGGNDSETSLGKYTDVSRSFNHLTCLMCAQQGPNCRVEGCEYTFKNINEMVASIEQHQKADAKAGTSSKANTQRAAANEGDIDADDEDFEGSDAENQEVKKASFLPAWSTTKFVLVAAAVVGVVVLCFLKLNKKI